MFPHHKYSIKFIAAACLRFKNNFHSVLFYSNRFYSRQYLNIFDSSKCTLNTI